MLLNKKESPIQELALIIYNFYKISINNKKSIKELLYNILRPIKKLLKESIASIIESELLK